MESSTAGTDTGTERITTRNGRRQTATSSVRSFRRIGRVLSVFQRQRLHLRDQKTIIQPNHPAGPRYRIVQHTSGTGWVDTWVGRLYDHGRDMLMQLLLKGRGVATAAAVRGGSLLLGDQQASRPKCEADGNINVTLRSHQYALRITRAY
jgi:hypothetical protein